MILVSSHLDRVIQDYSISFAKGTHTGLLDNFVGVLLTYLTLYDDQNLQRYEKEGSLAIFHGTGEEWGRLDRAPVLGKRDLAIVVDCADLPLYRQRKLDFAIENLSGFPTKETTTLKDHLEWEGFKTHVSRYNGKPLMEDESWSWRKRGVKTLSFTIPIRAPFTGWHRIQQDNTVALDKMLTCRQGLKRVLAYFMDDYGQARKR